MLDSLRYKIAMWLLPTPSPEEIHAQRMDDQAMMAQLVKRMTDEATRKVEQDFQLRVLDAADKVQ